MAFSDWSTVDAENDTSSGINIAENCPAANVNNWGRRIMAQLRAAFNPVLDTFFASTTLAQARTALGVPEGSTSMTAFSGLTNEANKVPYMTGSDGWATSGLTSFMRTVLDDGDAATARATLGAVGVTASSISSGSGYITFNISGTAFKLSWASGTATANTSTSISFPSAYSSWAKAWVSGGDNDTAATQNNPTITATSTTAATVTNANPASIAVTVFAIGV